MDSLQAKCRRQATDVRAPEGFGIAARLVARIVLARWVS